MDRKNQLQELSTAPQPFKQFLREQGQRQLETMSRVGRTSDGAVRVAPLVDEGSLSSMSQRSQDSISGASAQMTDQSFERQQQLLSSKGKITQLFGNKNPIEKFSGGINYGTDIGIPEGTKIALPDGEWEVVEAFNEAQGAGYIGNNTNRGYGNSVLVRNRDTGEMLRFSHLSSAMARAGQRLAGGTVVGLSGSTGNATGPHLDLEYYDQSGRLSDVLGSRYGGNLTATIDKTGARGGGNPLERVRDAGKTVLSHLDPANKETPILGPIRQAVSLTLGTPAYADSSLPLERRAQDAMLRYAEGSAGGIKTGKVSSTASRQFASNLRRGGKPDPTLMRAPDDELMAVADPVEQLLTNDTIEYFVSGLQSKHFKYLGDFADHYIEKGISKQFKNNPKGLARIVLERIMLDRAEATK